MFEQKQTSRRRLMSAFAATPTLLSSNPPLPVQSAGKDTILDLIAAYEKQVDKSVKTTELHQYLQETAPDSSEFKTIDNLVDVEFANCRKALLRLVDSEVRSLDDIVHLLEYVAEQEKFERRYELEDTLESGAAVTLGLIRQLKKITRYADRVCQTKSSVSPQDNEDLASRDDVIIHAISCRKMLADA